MAERAEDSRPVRAARRKARELAEHCAFYNIDMAAALGLTVARAGSSLELRLEEFDTDAFNAWRTRLGSALELGGPVPYAQVAAALEISERTARRYGQDPAAKIPRAIALACEALESRALRRGG